MSVKKKILIAGDIMLDTYHFGDVSRISPEAPVPVFLEKGKIKNVPGGAANVAINVAAINLGVDVFSATGNDRAGDELIELLNGQEINTGLISCLDDRQTTNKIRYIAQNNQQIMRSDIERTDLLPCELFSKSLEAIEKSIEEYGLILISDYKKGFLSVELTQAIIKIGSKYSVPVFIDVKDTYTDKYRGATLLKPNKKELSDLTGISVKSVDDAAEAAIRLCRDAECDYVLTTLGADGMLLADSTKVIKTIKSVAREVYDVTGAGDTSIAYLAAETVLGKDIIEAMEISNIAAGIQVAKVGTSVVYPEEVEKELSASKTGKRKVVFTNGCFDILHAGHVSYLKKARALGDKLIVGINPDDSVRRLKGDDRPVNTLEDRMAVLSELECVDEVIAFDEDTPAELIKKVRPDILVKGDDYIIEKIVGADFVMSYGGEVKTIPLLEGKSTTNIISKMRGVI